MAAGLSLAILNASLLKFFESLLALKRTLWSLFILTSDLLRNLG